MEEIEDNLALIEAAEVKGRHYRHQQQLGDGDVVLDHPGRFRFVLEPVVDRRSVIMGVRERVFRTRVR